MFGVDEDEGRGLGVGLRDVSSTGSKPFGRIRPKRPRAETTQALMTQGRIDWYSHPIPI